MQLGWLRVLFMRVLIIFVDLPPSCVAVRRYVTYYYRRPIIIC